MKTETQLFPFELHCIYSVLSRVFANYQIERLIKSAVKLPQCLTDEVKLSLVLITVLGFRKT